MPVYGLKCNYRQAGDPEVYNHATLVPIATLTVAARLPCYWPVFLQGEPGHKKSIPKFTSSFKLNKLIGVHNPHLKSPAKVNLILCNNIQHSRTILTFSLSLHNPLGHIITRNEPAAWHIKIKNLLTALATIPYSFVHSK